MSHSTHCNTVQKNGKLCIIVNHFATYTFTIFFFSGFGLFLYICSAYKCHMSKQTILKTGNQISYGLTHIQEGTPRCLCTNLQYHGHGHNISDSEILTKLLGCQKDDGK